MNGWELPEQVSLGSITYSFVADYRDILEILELLQDPDTLPLQKVYMTLSLFYDDFSSMPPQQHSAALEYLWQFINLGQEESGDRPAPQRIDWQQDRLLIVSDINRVAGCEVRALPFLHWWTFMAWFHAIGDGQLATVCAIRDKLRRGKPLDSGEREFYAENRARVDLKARYTAEEEAEQAELLRLLGEG